MSAYATNTGGGAYLTGAPFPIQQNWWPEPDWARWVMSGGELGEEPPDYVKKLYGLIGLAIPNFLLALVALWIYFSTTGKAIVGLFSSEYLMAPWSFGKFIDLLKQNGESLDPAQLDARGAAIRAIRGSDISMIFQEPMTSFSPLYTIGNQIAEVIKLHTEAKTQEAREQTIELLRQVEMPKPEQQVDVYSFNLSGGMRQRSMIAMAPACSPKLLIADEPTSALDVTIQAQILDLIPALQENSHMALMIITHDLGIVAQIAENVLIMYLGEGMEYGPVDDIYHNPKHPYTVGLIGSVPRIKTHFKEQLVPIKDSVPSLYERPSGCPFHTRCPRRIDKLCDRQHAPVITVELEHLAACHFAAELSLAGSR